jgi:16S rRNA (cytosine1407-C5)-methyltransferase
MKPISYLDMVKTLLPLEEFLEFEKYYTSPVRKSIKILSAKKEATRQQLKHDGWILTPPKFSRKGKTYDDVLFVDKSDKQSLGSHPLHAEGEFYVQEMSAGLSAQILDIQAEDLVLDMCAAPGGKSIQLADKLNNTGTLISNELNPSRRKALEANLERCGIWNAIITGYDGRLLGKLWYEQCDKVLIDAPCSGEGMQYKSDFKVYRWNEKAIRKLAQTQKELLLS